MTHPADLPTWAALLVAFFLVLGSGLTLIGAIGLLRLRSFYERMHAPTLGTTWGAGGILIASIICFSMLESRPVLHEILITVFVIVTTPVTLMLLARAALYRDRSETNGDVPGFEAVDGVRDEEGQA
ncbi:MAG: monovalent cation/H(+) antiporter subunit G [Pseudaminobacter sp.]